MKEYTYKGYKFHATNTMTEVRVMRFGRLNTELRPVYEISDLKAAGKRPFLTTIAEVREYIDINAK